jgi:hypothetical protein
MYKLEKECLLWKVYEIKFARCENHHTAAAKPNTIFESAQDTSELHFVTFSAFMIEQHSSTCSASGNAAYDFETAGFLAGHSGSQFRRLSPIFKHHCVSSITSTIISHPRNPLMTCWGLVLPWVRQSGIHSRICEQRASVSSFCRFR